MNEIKSKLGCVIFDIDGTLSDVTHRLHHIKDDNNDWYGFYEDMVNDPVNIPIAHLLGLYWLAGFNIYLLTGRPERYRRKTEDWLYKNMINYTDLFMRPGSKEYVKDSIIKEEMLKFIPDNIHLIVDDRKQVVDMWRAKGYICLQCAEGNF